MLWRQNFWLKKGQNCESLDLNFSRALRTDYIGGKGRHDIHHNNIQYKDTQHRNTEHYELNCATKHQDTLHKLYVQNAE